MYESLETSPLLDIPVEDETMPGEFMAVDSRRKQVTIVPGGPSETPRTRRDTWRITVDATNGKCK
jgi:hypothetical protein